MIFFFFVKLFTSILDNKETNSCVIDVLSSEAASAGRLIQRKESPSQGPEASLGSTTVSSKKDLCISTTVLQIVG